MPKRVDLELEFMPFFVDDFLDATMTWPAQRVGAYVRLMFYQWKRGSVPGDDVEELSRIVGELDPAVAAALWERLSAKFPKGDNGFRNQKVEDVRQSVLRRMRGNKNRTKAATEAAADAKRIMSRRSHGRVDASVTDTATSPSTDGNLETGNTENKELTPPLTPPLQGGEPNGSVTDGLTETKPTRAELKQAEDDYDELSGCPHDPECETKDQCLGRLVGERRARVHAGLAQGVREGGHD